MIGSRLKSLRDENNKLQSEVADDLKINRVTYNRYEREERSPDLETLTKIASYFDVSTDYLLGVSTEKKSFLPHPSPVEMQAKVPLMLREESTYFADEIIKEAETMDLSPEEHEALEIYKKMPPDEQQKELLETVVELLLDLPAKDREVIMQMIKAYALSLR